MKVYICTKFFSLHGKSFFSGDRIDEKSYLSLPSYLRANFRSSYEEQSNSLLDDVVDVAIDVAEAALIYNGLSSLFGDDDSSSSSPSFDGFDGGSSGGGGSEGEW